VVIHLGGSYFPPATNTDADAHAVGIGYHRIHSPNTDADAVTLLTDALDTIGYIHTSH